MIMHHALDSLSPMLRNRVIFSLNIRQDSRRRVHLAEFSIELLYKPFEIFMRRRSSLAKKSYVVDMQYSIQE